MISLDLGDPNAPTLTSPVTLPHSTAQLVIINDSPYQLLTQLPGQPQRKVPSGWARLFPVPANAEQLTWSIDKTLAAADALLSDVTLECFAAGENLPEHYPAQVVRQIGGKVNTVSSTQVQNDGMPLGTTFIEATAQLPQGINSFGSNVQGNVGGKFKLVGMANGAANVFLDVEPDTPDGDGTGPVVHVGGNQIPVFLGGSQISTGHGKVTITAGADLIHGGNGGFGNATASFDNGALTTDGSGNLTHVGGQATAGFGVSPVVIAPTKSAAITATTQQNLATFTAPADGLYRFSGALQVNNGVSGNAILLEVAYTSALDGAAHMVYITGQLSGVNGTSLFGGTTSQANGIYGLVPITVYAKSGTVLTISYRDPTNTPNDTVVYMLERLS